MLSDLLILDDVTMPRTSYHVIPNPNGGWSVKKEGSHRASKKFETKDSAVCYAREISRDRKTELYIHNKDGRISDRRSYGQNPFPPKDW